MKSAFSHNQDCNSTEYNPREKSLYFWGEGESNIDGGDWWGAGVGETLGDSPSYSVLSQKAKDALGSESHHMEMLSKAHRLSRHFMDLQKALLRSVNMHISSIL